MGHCVPSRQQPSLQYVQHLAHRAPMLAVACSQHRMLRPRATLSADAATGVHMLGGM